MTLRVTIVGCGAVAQRLYRKPLRQLEKRGVFEVASLVDSAAGNAAALGSYFPRARTYDELNAALSASASDLTLVLSPAGLHCKHAVAALESGSHVLCEKPIALSTADCERINRAGREANRVVGVAMIRRFFPAYVRFREIVQDGSLGELRRFEYREGHKFEWSVTTPAAFMPRKDGGTGVLFDIGPHVVDYVEWVLGKLTVLGYADDALGGIESNMSLQVQSAACRGSIDLSWDCPQANEFRVFGARGEAVLRVDRFDQMAVRVGSTFEPVPVKTSFPGDCLRSARKRVTPRSYPEAIYCQLVQMARAVVLGETPAVGGSDGASCIAVLEEALSVARPLDVPWLGPRESDAFRRMHWASRP